MWLNYIAIQIRRNFMNFSNGGIVPVTILAAATLMLQIITVQSASDTIENRNDTDETSPKIEKISENIIFKIGFAIYGVCTNRNVIIFIVVIVVLLCLAFKLTSIETFLRKKLREDNSETDIPLNNVNIDTSGYKYPIYEPQDETEISLENLTTDNTPKEQQPRYRNPKRVKRK